MNLSGKPSENHRNVVMRAMGRSGWRIRDSHVQCKESRIVDILTVVDEDPFFHHHHTCVANTCIVCLRSMYLLIQLPQSVVVTIVGSIDQVLCAPTKSSLTSHAVAVHSVRAGNNTIHMPLQSKPFCRLMFAYTA